MSDIDVRDVEVPDSRMSLEMTSWSVSPPTFPVGLVCWYLFGPPAREEMCGRHNGQTYLLVGVMTPLASVAGIQGQNI